MAAEKKKSGIGGTIVLVLLIAAVIIGIYMSVTRKKNTLPIEAEGDTSEVATLISRDIDKNYPSTVREVMKLYCRITQTLYSEDLSDDQIDKLIDQIRELYSDDLLKAEGNDKVTMLGLARGEIKHYRSNKMSIQSYNIEEAGEVKYYRNETPQRAVINLYFTIKQDKEFVRAYEEFVLVQDKDSRWKILGWRLAEE